MMKPTITFLFFLVMVLSAHAADWYVDCAGTNATQNGQAWATAWRGFTNINMSGVNPGDTIHISGGTYWGGATLYSTSDKGGTAASPITFKASQEVGHDSKVILNGTINFNKSHYIFDGAKSDTVEAQITNTWQVERVATNCNWQINGYVPQLGSTNCCFGFVAGDFNGVEIKWIEGTAQASAAETRNSGPGQNCRFITMQEMTVNLTNIVRVHHSYVHDVAWDVIHSSGVKVAAPLSNYCGGLTFDHILAERIGQDFFEVSGNRRVHHCIIRQTLGYEGHQDVFSASGYSEFYNNVIYDFAFDGNLYYNFNNATPNVDGHGRFYGNLLYYTPAFWTNSFTNRIVSSGLQAYEEDGYTGGAVGGWTDLLWANNTVYCTNALGGPFGIGNTKYPGVVFWITNAAFLNNITVQANTNATSTISFGGPANRVPYFTNGFLVDYNTLSGLRTLTVGYNDTLYPNAEALGPAVGYYSNVSAFPIFINVTTNNFALANSDTAARGRGTNLSSLNLLGWETDLAGNPRVHADGAVDTGALSYVTNAPPEAPISPTLLVWFTFDDLTNVATSPIVTDASGNSHNLSFVGFDATPTNWPTRIDYTNGSGNAARFVPDYGTWNGDGLGGGQYGAITNLSGLTNMTEITVAVWARYFIPPFTGADGSCCFVDVSYGTNGCSWSLGRNYALQTSFDIFTNLDYNTDHSLHLNYPDNESTSWHHYAATFDCASQIMNIYLDGTNCGTKDFTGYSAALTNLTVCRTYSTGTFPGREGWLAIGCRTHSGSPDISDGDGFPNNGWHNGELHDFRIYNYALTAAEIAGLASGSAPIQPTPAPPRKARIRRP